MSNNFGMSNNKDVTVEARHLEIHPDAARTLCNAINEYSYPAVVYDFESSRKLCFNTMLDLEAFIKTKLLSPHVKHLKDALSAILYWGHYRAGYRDRRVAKFRHTVTDGQLQDALEMFPRVRGPALIQLKGLGLPEFSNVSFLSKVRMFLDPDNYCVLDRKLMTLEPLRERFKVYPTYIPVNKQNESAYEWWAGYCRNMARALACHSRLRAADVERGFFQLVEADKITPSILLAFERIG